MHRECINIEIIRYDTDGNETDIIIEKLFDSLLQRYQKGLENKKKWSEFVLDSVDLLYYKLHKIGLNRARSYIDSPKWLKSKKAIINLKNTDDKFFQYAVTIRKDPRQI